MTELKLDWCSHEAAKYAVEHWHYSRCMPKSKLAKIGVWESGQFIGCVIFGVGAVADLVKSYGLQDVEGCELVRVALNKHVNTVSKIVSIALRLLKKEMPGLRLVVSFADPEHAHVGGGIPSNELDLCRHDATKPRVPGQWQAMAWAGFSCLKARPSYDERSGGGFRP